MLTSLKDAYAEMIAGYRWRDFAVALAHEEVGDQYRRTALGPVWLIVNYMAFVITFVAIFRRGDGPYYPAYVSTGLLVWFYLREVTTLSVSLFVREENMIKGTSLPLSVYIIQLSLQIIIRGGYSTLGCIAVLLFVQAPFGPVWAWSLVGILVIVAMTPAVIAVMAVAGAFFPDLQFVTPHVMRIGMFLTPVFWTPRGHDNIRALLYTWNPFTYFVEIVRMPIVDGRVPYHALGFCAAVGLGFWLLAFYLLGRFRKRIVFVL